MSDRLSSMSRFAEPDEMDEPKVVGECTCCYEELYEGDDAYICNGYTYCSESCVLSDLDMYKIQLEGDC